MAEMRDIRRRIRSVKGIEQITKAMKMIASAKLRKTQSALLAARTYVEKMAGLVTRVSALNAGQPHLLMTCRSAGKTGIILISSDRGLAGGYNANLFKEAAAFETRLNGTKTGYIAWGKKGRDYLRSRGSTIIRDFTGLSDRPSFHDSRELAGLALQLFAEGTFDEICLLYQEFISAAHQIPVIKRLLPVLPETGEWDRDISYLYEPGPEEILDNLLPQYINSLIFQALLEAKASEHGARMVAMSSAAENAKEMIDKLALSYNQARQAAITREIIEIIGGANALQA